MAKEGYKKDSGRFQEVEEMYCPKCDVVTGHTIKNDAFTCEYCDTPLKGDKGFIYKVWNVLRLERLTISIRLTKKKKN
jgi:hypothetical protein